MVPGGVWVKQALSAVLGLSPTTCSAFWDDQLALAPSLELTWCPLSLQ